MKTKKNDIIMQNRIFVWIAAVIGLVLLVPFLAMQFDWVPLDPDNPADQGMNWTPADFITMGLLLLGMSFLFVHIARVAPRRYRTLIGLACTAVFLWIWAELAVGVFINIGS